MMRCAKSLRTVVLLVSAALVVGPVCMPASAYATAATRIVVSASAPAATVRAAVSLQALATTTRNVSLGRQSLFLEQAVDGVHWSRVGTFVTSRAGKATAAVKPVVKMRYRFRFPGSKSYRPSVSNAIWVKGWDTTSPSTTCNAQDVGGQARSFVGSSTITLTAKDGGSGVGHTYYVLDSNPRREGRAFWISRIGAHTLTFWSMDKAGNVEAPHKVTFFVTSAGPITTSDALPSYAGIAVIHLSATTPAGGPSVARTYYVLDGGPQTEGTTITVTSTGSHALDFWSVDMSGTVEPRHATVTFTVTATRPLTSSDARPAYVGVATIHLTAITLGGGPSIAHTFYILDGGPQTEGSTIMVSSIGWHVLDFWSVDAAGNVEATRNRAEFIVSAEPPPPPPISPTFSGTGTRVVGPFHLDAGLAVFSSNGSCAGYFSVWLKDANGADVDLVASEIGPCSVSAATNIAASGDYYLQVQSDGSWNIDVQEPRVTSAPTTRSFSGGSDVVTSLFYLPSGAHVFNWSHAGDGYFSVWLLDQNGVEADLVASVIGRASGSYLVGQPAGIYLFEVTASGPWSLSY